MKYYRKKDFPIIFPSPAAALSLSTWLSMINSIWKTFAHSTGPPLKSLRIILETRVRRRREKNRWVDGWSWINLERHDEGLSYARLAERMRRRRRADLAEREGRLESDRKKSERNAKFRKFSRSMSYFPRILVSPRYMKALKLSLKLLFLFAKLVSWPDKQPTDSHQGNDDNADRREKKSFKWIKFLSRLLGERQFNSLFRLILVKKKKVASCLTFFRGLLSWELECGWKKRMFRCSHDSRFPFPEKFSLHVVESLSTSSSSHFFPSSYPNSLLVTLCASLSRVSSISIFISKPFASLSFFSIFWVDYLPLVNNLHSKFFLNERFFSLDAQAQVCLNFLL